MEGDGLTASQSSWMPRQVKAGLLYFLNTAFQRPLEFKIDSLRDHQLISYQGCRFSYTSCVSATGIGVYVVNTAHRAYEVNAAPSSTVSGMAMLQRSHSDYLLAASRLSGILKIEHLDSVRKSAPETSITTFQPDS